MQSMNALSLAPDVNDWLTNSRQPRILHVFGPACNLINERREVLSIVTQQIGNGPFNLVIEDGIIFSDHLNTQSPISIRAHQLNLGDLIINTVNAEPWSARPDWEVLHTKRDDILNHLSSLRASDSERSNPHHREEIASSPRSRYALRKERSGLLATTLPLTNYQSPISNSLVPALANADLPNCLDSARQLAGLGAGLTPAGDDFILGAVLAAWIIHPADVARVLAEEITTTAAALTTSLSAAWLRSAGRGQAGILWHEFFDALISLSRIAYPAYLDRMAVQESMEELLGIGDTSGADALAGFIGTFVCWAASVSLENRSFPS
jgi:hypothetical protein